MPTDRAIPGFAMLFGLLLAPCAARAAAPVTPAIPGVVSAGTPIDLVREGFAGSEGPVAMSDGSLLFTENQAGKVTRIAADGSVSEFLTNADKPNALGFTPRGDLVAVMAGRPSLAVVSPGKNARTLVDSFEGKPLNRPNDLVVDRKGGVYFTDPGGRQPPPIKAVYYCSADGALKRVADDIAVPNGIQLSPDEKVLYVADSDGEYVLAYNVAVDGSISGRRNFARASGADGLAVDADGRLYAATKLGVQVFSASGAPLGTIGMPQPAQNLAFAGEEKRVLYVVGRGAVHRIRTLARGIASRGK